MRPPIPKFLVGVHRATSIDWKVMTREQMYMRLWSLDCPEDVEIFLITPRLDKESDLPKLKAVYGVDIIYLYDRRRNEVDHYAKANLDRGFGARRNG